MLLAILSCLNALTIVGNKVINDNYIVKSQQPDSVKIAQILMNAILAEKPSELLCAMF